jgi:hypothetical protein
MEAGRAYLCQLDIIGSSVANLTFQAGVTQTSSVVEIFGQNPECKLDGRSR